jgi:glyoxylase-like metal-dependent hydrolase (beta-lactamase superfamily II)
MRKATGLFRILIITFGCTSVHAQYVEMEPYSLTSLSDRVFRIVDGSESNPPGIHLDDQGERVGLNNTSDIYLLIGTDQALIIDLSNDASSNEAAVETLRELVDERAGSRELFITATHSHFDHLGMLDVFRNDPATRFWVSGPEFQELGVFPSDRTEFFTQSATLDLGGGLIVESREMPGHTPHSTLFLVRSENLIFTGDAIGSGSGVWLFDYTSFVRYRESVDRLVDFLRSGESGFDISALRFESGHSWQYGDIEELTAQYLFDMQALINRMGTGTAETAEVSLPIPYLDTNFSFGKATITWNRAAADRFAAEYSQESAGL